MKINKKEELVEELNIAISDLKKIEKSGSLINVLESFKNNIVSNIKMNELDFQMLISDISRETLKNHIDLPKSVNDLMQTLNSTSIFKTAFSGLWRI